MPDAHQGYGVSIGTVLATDKVVVPNAVGVDIGCGMCAVKTSLRAEQLDKETIKRIFGGSKEYQGGIRSCVPVGFDHQSKKQDSNLMPPLPNTPVPYLIIEREYDSALKQIGTLGGGNHFIEIQKDTEGFVWIMIHSGSRNLGLKVADYYNQLAYDLNKRWYSNTYLPKNPKDSLAFLPIESKEAKDYMLEMQYCVDFALANRKLMMDNILEVFKSVLFSYFATEPMINIAHNYAKWENHFGQNVIVHRKGATLAREGVIGIIPGSQGTKSYIVKGKGNKESFESCSHGAGRAMGRKEAERSLNLEEQIKIMDDQGIIHGIRNNGNLDEAPGAYKNIDVVMNNQKDLVEILVELSPLAVIKDENQRKRR
jgi:tRNA-splicing ligase RtcB